MVLDRTWSSSKVGEHYFTPLGVPRMIGAAAGHTNLAEYSLGRFLKCVVRKWEFTAVKENCPDLPRHTVTRAKWAAGYTYKHRQVPTGAMITDVPERRLKAKPTLIIFPSEIRENTRLTYLLTMRHQISSRIKRPPPRRSVRDAIAITMAQRCLCSTIRPLPASRL